jgi:hypothetical protein
LPVTEKLIVIKKAEHTKYDSVLKKLSSAATHKMNQCKSGADHHEEQVEAVDFLLVLTCLLQLNKYMHKTATEIKSSTSKLPAVLISSLTIQQEC